jgi:hypothetical protein
MLFRLNRDRIRKGAVVEPGVAGGYGRPALRTELARKSPGRCRGFQVKTK